MLKEEEEKNYKTTKIEIELQESYLQFSENYILM